MDWKYECKNKILIFKPGESIHITGPGGRLIYLGYGNV